MNLCFRRSLGAAEAQARRGGLSFPVFGEQAPDQVHQPQCVQLVFDLVGRRALESPRHFRDQQIDEPQPRR